MNELFNNARSLERFIKYLNYKNPHINWDLFLSQNYKTPTVKLLQKIKSKLWTDSEDREFMEKDLYKIYLEYMTIYYSIISRYNIKEDVITILSIPKYINNTPDEIIDIIQLRINILTRILEFGGIQFELVDDIPEKYTVLIPTALLLYTKELQYNDNIIIDGYNNICKDKSDEIYLKYVLIIESILVSTMDINDILDTPFVYLKLY